MKNLDKIAKRKLADVLLENKTLTKEQIKIATDQTIATDKPLQEILVTSQMVHEEEISIAIARLFTLPLLRLSQADIDLSLVSLFNADLLQRHQFIPFGRCGRIIMVAISNILSYPIMNQIEEISQCEIFLYVGIPSEIKDYLDKNLIKIEAPSVAMQTMGMAWDTMFDLANDSISGGGTSTNLPSPHKDDSGNFKNPLETWNIE